MALPPVRFIPLYTPPARRARRRSGLDRPEKYGKIGVSERARLGGGFL